jgi:hypothetical protein
MPTLSLLRHSRGSLPREESLSLALCENNSDSTRAGMTNKTSSKKPREE